MEDRLPRKLAAVLYADVAGYSRLTGDDEDATHRTLSEYLDLISATVETHHGKVMHYAGDAVLAKFDAVVDSLSGATEIQKLLFKQNEDLPAERRVYFRIGLNLGDVIEDRGDIYGDGVNIAARLESLAEPGGICVSESVRSAVKNKIDLEYEEMGDQILKNIEEPVRVYRIIDCSMVSAATKSDKATTPTTTLGFVSPDRPSIAILPFKSLGNDPDQNYLADGVRFGIQASLVQLPGLFLVNASTLNAYRDKDISAMSAGVDLEVMYVLEGSVQQAGDRVRAMVQLTDVSTGQAIWAEHYDRILDDVFEMQDEITREVIASLNEKLLHQSVNRIWFGKLTSPEAREYFYRGSSYLYEGNKEDNAKARHMYEELYRVQPDTVIGPANIAITHWVDLFFGWSDSAEKSKELAAEWARLAIQYQENNGMGHAVLGHLQLLDGNHDEALATCSAGVELRSSCPLTHGLLGLVQNYCGDARAAVSHLREALLLEKIYPVWLINFLATAYRDCGEIDLSIAAAKEAQRLQPQIIDSQLILCSDYQLGDDHEQARNTAEKIMANNPSFSLSSYASNQPYKEPAPLDRVIEALREAGLPE